MYVARCSELYAVCPQHRCTGSSRRSPRHRRVSCNSYYVNIISLYMSLPSSRTRLSTSIPLFQASNVISLWSFSRKASNTEPAGLLVIAWPRACSYVISQNLRSRACGNHLWRVTKTTDDSYLRKCRGAAGGRERACADRETAAEEKGRHFAYWEIGGKLI